MTWCTCAPRAPPARGGAGPDDLVARLGGDEFAVLARRVRDAEAAVTIAERVRTALDAELVIDGQIIDLEGSIGVALVPDHATEYEVLFSRPTWPVPGQGRPDGRRGLRLGARRELDVPHRADQRPAQTREHLPSPLVDHDAKRQERHFLERARHQQADVA